MDDSVYTGDVHSDFVIHQKEQFQWLNDQIGRHMRLYLQELGVDITDLEIYAQKSWPTVCNKKKGEVDEHTHENAHFSCVYYLSVDESNYSGILLPPGRRLARMNFRSHITVNGHRWLIQHRKPAPGSRRDM